MQSWLLNMNTLYVENPFQGHQPSDIVEIQKQFSETKLLSDLNSWFQNHLLVCLKTGHMLGIDSIIVFSGIWPLNSIRTWDNYSVVLFLSCEKYSDSWAKCVFNYYRGLKNLLSWQQSFKSVL